MRILFFIFLVILTSCGNLERIDTSKIQEEVEHHKVKRITETQIQELVAQKGKKMIDYIEKKQNCADKQLLDSLGKQYNILISLRTEADLSNKTILQKEQEVLDAYLYNKENNLPIVENIQKLNDALVLYTLPMSQKCSAINQTKLAIWSVQFSKKEIIRNTTVKELKLL